jgi:hypothetical protein
MRRRAIELEYLRDWNECRLHIETHVVDRRDGERSVGVEVLPAWRKKPRYFMPASNASMR